MASPISSDMDIVGWSLLRSTDCCASAAVTLLTLIKTEHRKRQKTKKVLIDFIELDAPPRICVAKISDLKAVSNPFLELNPKYWAINSKH
jgi:hypothetical protein